MWKTPGFPSLASAVAHFCGGMIKKARPRNPRAAVVGKAVGRFFYTRERHASFEPLFPSPPFAYPHNMHALHLPRRVKARYISCHLKHSPWIKRFGIDYCYLLASQRAGTSAFVAYGCISSMAISAPYLCRISLDVHVGQEEQTHFCRVKDSCHANAMQRRGKSQANLV